MINYQSRRLLGWLAMASGIVLFCAGYARAQVPDIRTHPELWVNIGQDCIANCRVIGSDTVPADAIAASYSFGMIYDSVSRTDYTFTECRRNGGRIPLLHWRRHHLVHMDADVMSYNSRTASFPLVGGDTLGFFRELKWYDPMTREQTPDNYYALDTLAYAVELVRASDGAVLALLDSIGVMPSLARNTPVIHGTRPILAQVRYVVPGALACDSAFIGIRLYAHGDGAYNFLRYDGETIALSDMLNDPYWIDYLRVYGYGLGLARRAVDDLSAGEAAGMLTVEARAGGEALIRFRAPDPGPTSVAIYDAAGQLLFYPYAGPSPEGSMSVAYRFPAGGLYFVVLMQEGKIVATNKTTITN